MCTALARCPGGKLQRSVLPHVQPPCCHSCYPQPVLWSPELCLHTHPHLLSETAQWCIYKHTEYLLENSLKSCMNKALVPRAQAGQAEVICQHIDHNVLTEFDLGEMQPVIALR